MLKKNKKSKNLVTDRISLNQRENCRNLKKEVRGICPFFENTTNDDDYLNHISKDTIIFHFTPLFSSVCSSLSRILVCSTLFPFCSAHYHCFAALPRNLFSCQHFVQARFHGTLSTMARVPELFFISVTTSSLFTTVAIHHSWG